MLKLFKKKKKDSKGALPPPSPPEDKPKIPVGDFPKIVPEKELPPPPANEKDMPELQFPVEEEEDKPTLPPPPKPAMPEQASFAPRPSVERPFPKFEKPSPKVFDKTVEEELPSKKVVRPKLQPIFVGVDDYKFILNNTNVIRSKLLEAEDFAKKLNSLKHKETKILDKWHSRIEEIDKKLTYVDKVLSKAQG
ncbi:hypothetical protein GF358_02360 [Candidatus Woesearchaeota archaeon]|nr:hypothetical protein [Candidatus Woesearchaeota archaeon]